MWNLKFQTLPYTLTIACALQFSIDNRRAEEKNGTADKISN